MNQNNGLPKANGRTPKSPFQQLSDMIMGLASARTKQEAMARLTGCQRLLGAIEVGFEAQSHKVARLQQFVLDETKGEIRRLTFNVDQPDQVTGYEFVDSAGAAVMVMDPQAGAILVTPETVEPVIVTIHRKDGTKEVITVAHQGRAADDPEPPAPEVVTD